MAFMQGNPYYTGPSGTAQGVENFTQNFVKTFTTMAENERQGKATILAQQKMDEDRRQAQQMEIYQKAMLEMKQQEASRAQEKYLREQNASKQLGALMTRPGTTTATGGVTMPDTGELSTAPGYTPQDIAAIVAQLDPATAMQVLTQMQQGRLTEETTRKTVADTRFLEGPKTAGEAADTRLKGLQAETEAERPALIRAEVGEKNRGKELSLGNDVETFLASQFPGFLKDRAARDIAYDQWSRDPKLQQGYSDWVYKMSVLKAQQLYTGTSTNGLALLLNAKSGQLTEVPYPGGKAPVQKNAEPLPVAVMTGFIGALDSLDILNTLRETVPAAVGGLPGYGEARAFVKSKLGNEDVQRFQSALFQLKANVQSIIKGIPSNFDVQTFQRTMASEGLTEKEANSRIDIQEQLLKNVILANLSNYAGMNVEIPKELLQRAAKYGLFASPTESAGTAPTTAPAQQWRLKK